MISLLSSTAELLPDRRMSFSNCMIINYSYLLLSIQHKKHQDKESNSWKENSPIYIKFFAIFSYLG